MGGLGNQMFQIAAAYAHAAENNQSLGFFEEKHSLPLQGFKFKKYKKSVFRNVKVIDELPGFRRYIEPYFHYRKIPTAKDLIIRGYFQSEKYFKACESNIRQFYSMPERLKEYIFNKYPDISQNSVSVHVRRGDYVNLQGHHPLQRPEYYTRGLAMIGGRPKIYVFSDDLDWCKENLSFGDYFIDEEDDVCLYAMSLCRDNILANSTFSWWAAWLNENPNKKVVVPHRWFGDRLSGYKTRDLFPWGWDRI